MVLGSISFAFWKLEINQEEENIATMDCFEIEFQESEAITLTQTHPISDERGMNLTPYTFSIKNVCKGTAVYQVNLEEIASSKKRLDYQYLKISFHDKLAKLSTFELVSPTLENADISHKLITGVLNASEVVTYDLRLWVDYDTPPSSSVMNAFFQSKIVVIAVSNNSLPKVEIASVEQQDGIRVDISEVENPSNESLNYFYRLNENTEI